jgi:hypothetical protein
VIVAQGTELLEANVLATYAFLKQRAIPFVSRFDAIQEA